MCVGWIAVWEGTGVEAGVARAEFCLVVGRHLLDGILCILWNTILGSSNK